MNPTLKTFFDHASPATLASLIADIETGGSRAEYVAAKLMGLARKELVANVGEDEADQLISAAVAPAA